jgi:hypothetical protein
MLDDQVAFLTLDDSEIAAVDELQAIFGIS